MKKLLLLLSIACCATTSSIAQSTTLEIRLDSLARYWSTPWSGDVIVADSLVWKVTKVLAEGQCSCEHIWVEGEFELAGNCYGCGVMHHCETCEYCWNTKKRICKSCGRHEALVEYRYEHCEHIESEYEKVKREKTN